MTSEEAKQIAIKTWGNPHDFTILDSKVWFEQDTKLWIVVFLLDVPWDPSDIIILVDPNTGKTTFSGRP